MWEWTEELEPGGSASGREDGRNEDYSREAMKMKNR